MNYDSIGFHHTFRFSYLVLSQRCCFGYVREYSCSCFLLFQRHPQVGRVTTRTSELWSKSGESVDVSVLSEWKLSVCPFPTDHLVS